jgi:hypothetical protein
VPAASAIDWLASVCTPAANDVWPWYDSTAMVAGTGASPFSSTLNMTDSPACSIPAAFDPNHPADPRSANALATAAETFAVDFRVGVRTVDTDLAADTHFFEAAKSSWSANYVFPVVPGVSIVTTGAVWAIPAAPFEITINIVPAVTNGNGPFLRWIPT